MNRLLKKQLNQYLGGIENVPVNMMPFINAIERSYNDYEDDKVLLERSMDINSKELHKSNQKLRKDSKRQQEVLTRLKSSLKTLFSLQLGKGEFKMEEETDILKTIELIELQAKRIKEMEGELVLINNLVDQSTDSVQVADEEGNFIFVNQETCKRFRLPKEELLKKNVKEIELVFRGIPGAWEAHVEDLKSKDMLLAEGENVRMDGSKFPVEVSVRYVEIENKGYVTAFSRDITERKKNEQKINEAVTDLKKVNAELENFAYVVSHDLKAPLRGIGSLTDWLIQDHIDCLKDEAKEMLFLMKKRVLRLHDLIEGILQYSKVGRTGANKVDVDINKIIAEIIDSIENPKKIQIKFPQNFPVIYNNEIAIQQVFQNLISNSIKYHDKKDGWVRISYEERGNMWQFCIEDDGAGIDKKHHERIFKIFQTLSTQDSIKSTGIGLTIVKKIVETDDGEIWLESEKGKGTKFFFTLKK